HPVDGPGRRAGACCGFVHHLGHPGDALHRGRVRAEDNGATRFDRDENLVDRRRGGVGRGHDRGGDAEGPGAFDDARAFGPRGRGIAWTETSSPTRRAAAAPASVAAFTAPTSPRTSTVT